MKTPILETDTKYLKKKSSAHGTLFICLFGLTTFYKKKKANDSFTASEKNKKMLLPLT